MQKNIDGYFSPESLYLETSSDYNKIHRSKYFIECMDTYFDISDDKTRLTLLSVNEADQNSVMQALAVKLYSHIVEKVDNIDFGTIPNSRGNIRTIENFAQMNDCIDILTQILQSYRQPTIEVDTVAIAISNIVDRTEIFTRSYKLNIEFPIVIYNTIVLSIVSALSLLISTHIEFIKTPNNQGYDIAFNKSGRTNSKNKLLFDTLKNFNNMCSNGELDKILKFAIDSSIHSKRESAISNGELTPMKEFNFDFIAHGVRKAASAFGTSNVVGWFKTAFDFLVTNPIGITITVIVSIIALIKLIRGAIYYFYYFRTKLSDMLDSLSILTYANATNIQKDLTKDENERKKISDRQRRMAEYFKVLSEKLKVKDISADNDATKAINAEDREKITVDELPITASTRPSGGLF